MAANTRSSNVRFHLLEKCSLELAVLIIKITLLS